MLPLGLLAAGESGEISAVRGNLDELLQPAGSCGCSGAGECQGCHGHGRCHGHGHHGHGHGHHHNHDHCRGRVQGMGLCTGRTVRMLANNPGLPLLVKVGESRLAIDRGIAMKIIVRRFENDPCNA